MSKIKIRKISKETAERVKEFSQNPYEKFSQWIPAGSGNYEKIKDNGKYRETCNKIYFKLKCESNHNSRKVIYSHCNKLDCSTCFISASSRKARELNNRIIEFRRLSYKQGIPIGKILHFSIILDTERKSFVSQDGYKKFKRNVIYPMLKDIGIVGGILFLHIWSSICLKCGENHYFCECKDSKTEKRVNIHIHVVGFGYLIDVREFKRRYPNFIYRNHLPRREDAFYTNFYILSKIALWKKEGGKLLLSYNYFGYLSPRVFGIVEKQSYKITDRCEECKRPRIVEECLNTEITHKWVYSIKGKNKTYKIKNVENLRKLVSEKYSDNR